MPEVKPKLLFLCQTLPYPPDGGVEIRSYNLMRLLSTWYDVHALCFFRKATRPSDGDVQRGRAGLSEIADPQIFEIPQETSRPRFVVDHLRSVLTRRAYTHYAYESEAYTNALRSLLDEHRFDLVHMDSLDLSAYLPLLDGYPVVCTHHNVESDLLDRRARSERSAIIGQYLRLQAELMRREEARLCPDMALNIAVSDRDAQRLGEIAPGAKFMVVPNGVDTEAYEVSTGDANGVVFVGGYSWYPNRDAMEHFADDILPVLRELNSDVTATWVGRAPEAVVSQFASRGVRLTGYVDDIRPHVGEPACYIVPLRVGGGSRLKILDAWAMGKAVVSTAVGCEGLDARDGENILIRDTSVGFAEAVQEVLSNSDLRRRLGREARRTAETVYDWQVLGASVHSAYEAVRNGAGTEVG